MFLYIQRETFLFIEMNNFTLLAFLILIKFTFGICITTSLKYDYNA